MLMKKYALWPGTKIVIQHQLRSPQNPRHTQSLPIFQNWDIITTLLIPSHCFCSFPSAPIFPCPSPSPQIPP